MITTYQDLLKCESEDVKQDFIYNCISRFRSSGRYKQAEIARQYYNNHNPTIEAYQKLVRTVTGETMVDDMAANHKIKNSLFRRFLTQQVQFLLGNGIMWASGKQDQRLGDTFESNVQDAAKEALIGGVSYGFFNLDHVDIFKFREFIPLYDENDGALKAGIRWWQMDTGKPLRATLYELEGYTEYSWADGQCQILQDRRTYVIKYIGTENEGMKIYAGENYPSFPIVPFYAQESHESLLEGHRDALDAYDMIMSGFCNTVDEASEIFWLIQNAGGMDEVDLGRFLQQIRRTHAAVVDEDGAKAEAHTIDIPYEARTAVLEKLEKDLFRDFMAFDPRSITGGAVTATEITAGYEPLNSKEDEFEKSVTDFVKGILAVAGIDDDPTYTRSMIINKAEEVELVLQAASFLPNEYVTKKILTILGDIDMADEILAQMEAEELERMNVIANGSFGQGNGQAAGETGEEGQEGL